MKKLWQKWSYEIPLAIGDALWEVLVVQFAAFLDRLTVRKVVEFVAIALLVMAFAQTLPIRSGDPVCRRHPDVSGIRGRHPPCGRRDACQGHAAIRRPASPGWSLRALNAALRLPALMLRQAARTAHAAAFEAAPDFRFFRRRPRVWHRVGQRSRRRNRANSEQARQQHRDALRGTAGSDRRRRPGDRAPRARCRRRHRRS